MSQNSYELIMVPLVIEIIDEILGGWCSYNPAIHTDNVCTQQFTSLFQCFHYTSSTTSPVPLRFEIQFLQDKQHAKFAQLIQLN